MVGAGGIGSSVAMYLAAAGVPLSIMDFDAVELSNLHRQVIHDEENEGKNKSLSAVERLQSMNSLNHYKSIPMKLTTSNAESVTKDFDLVVDATDNFEARYIINDACMLNGVPFVSGSAVGMEGQVTVFVPSKSPCYRCIYPQTSFSGEFYSTYIHTHTYIH